MLGPGDLLRLPSDALRVAERLVDEVAALRRLAEDASARLDRELADVRAEWARLRRAADDRDARVARESAAFKGELREIRRQLEAVANTLPTDNDKGPLSRVKDALTPDESR